MDDKGEVSGEARSFNYVAAKLQLAGRVCKVVMLKLVQEVIISCEVQATDSSGGTTTVSARR